MKIFMILSFGIWIGLMLIESAAAEEQKLNFRAVLTEVGGSTMDIAGLKERTMGASKYVGSAVFEDGRIAYKTAVAIRNSAGEAGKYSGYSNYMFHNGDALLVKFNGGWSSGSNGGDYEVVSGTGVYEGATGTGRFNAVKNPWKGAELYEGSISVKLPDQ